MLRQRAQLGCVVREIQLDGVVMLTYGVAGFVLIAARGDDKSSSVVWAILGVCLSGAILYRWRLGAMRSLDNVKPMPEGSRINSRARSAMAALVRSIAPGAVAVGLGVVDLYGMEPSSASVLSFISAAFVVSAVTYLVMARRFTAWQRDKCSRLLREWLPVSRRGCWWLFEE